MFTSSFLSERNLFIITGVATLVGAVYAGDVMRNWVALDFDPLRALFIILLVAGCGVLGLVGVAMLYGAMAILTESPGEERGLWMAAIGCVILGFFYGMNAQPFTYTERFMSYSLRDGLILLFGMALGVLILTIAHDTKRKIG
jgi:hypothetical protein